MIAFISDVKRFEIFNFDSTHSKANQTSDRRDLDGEGIHWSRINLL
jgi:hypothetical protein